MKKADVQQVVDALPEEGEVDIDRLLYTLWLRRKVELAEACPEDEDITQEELDRLSESWAS